VIMRVSHGECDHRARGRRHPCLPTPLLDRAPSLDESCGLPAPGFTYPEIAVGNDSYPRRRDMEAAPAGLPSEAARLVLPSNKDGPYHH